MYIHRKITLWPSQLSYNYTHPSVNSINNIITLLSTATLSHKTTRGGRHVELSENLSTISLGTNRRIRATLFNMAAKNEVNMTNNLFKYHEGKINETSGYRKWSIL